MTIDMIIDVIIAIQTVSKRGPWLISRNMELADTQLLSALTVTKTVEAVVEALEQGEINIEAWDNSQEVREKKYLRHMPFMMMFILFSL
jgi:hypothetical protein